MISQIQNHTIKELFIEIEEPSNSFYFSIDSDDMEMLFH